MWEWLNGKKTQLGGIIKILSGVAAILGAIAAFITKLVEPESEVGLGFDAAVTALLAGVYMVGQGFSTIGMGHKLEKSREAAIETAASAKSIAASNKDIAQTNSDLANMANPNMPMEKK